jgi:hypothetical protein
MSYQAESRAATSAGGAGAARAPCLASGSYLDGQNRLAGLPLPYVAYVCFRCFKRFRCMLQFLNLDVANVDQGMLYMLHMLQVFQSHIASVCSKCLISLQTSVAIIFIWMLHMLQHYVQNISVCFGLMLEQVVSYCMLQVFYFGCFICFTHILQGHVSNVSSFLTLMLHSYCKCLCCKAWGEPEASGRGPVGHGVLIVNHSSGSSVLPTRRVGESGRGQGKGRLALKRG